MQYHSQYVLNLEKTLHPSHTTAYYTYTNICTYVHTYVHTYLLLGAQSFLRT